MPAWIWAPLLALLAGPPDFTGARGLLEEAVASGAFPGGCAAAGTSRDVLWIEGFGFLDRSLRRPARPSTLYDLASLTKALGTTSVALLLVRDGRLRLSDPLEEHLPEFTRQAGHDEERAWRRRVTVEHLLTHTAGLAPWRPFYREARGARELLAMVLATPLEAPPGTRTRYSDLGFILLGEALARAGGKPLPELERELVFEPLGMRETLRNPPPSLLERIAPTEVVRQDGEERPIHGVVHDENARAAGGTTGHAGVFSTARDVARLAAELLRAFRGESRIFPHALVVEFTRRRRVVPGSSRALGWESATGENSAGALLGPRAFGHTGFTGTSLWVDPELDLYVVLLTNRVHPSRRNDRIAAVRWRLADAVVRAVRASRRRRL